MTNSDPHLPDEQDLRDPPCTIPLSFLKQLMRAQVELEKLHSFSPPEIRETIRERGVEEEAMIEEEGTGFTPSADPLLWLGDKRVVPLSEYSKREYSKRTLTNGDRHHPTSEGPEGTGKGHRPAR